MNVNIIRSKVKNILEKVYYAIIGIVGLLIIDMIIDGDLSSIRDGFLTFLSMSMVIFWIYTGIGKVVDFIFDCIDDREYLEDKQYKNE